MLYRVIGLMSGSSLDGLDIAFTEIQENAGKWSYEILEADCYSYPKSWSVRLKEATQLIARDYLLLHTEYGHYLGQQVNRFIEQYALHYKVALVSSHGHTTFHLPARGMTAQLGDGSAIAAETRLPVVSDLRSMDLAFGGQGAPIVPIGERLLLNEYDYFLNLGGIANISFNHDRYIAFDVCPANRVLNMLAMDAGKEYDDKGQLASAGTIKEGLLKMLNDLDYYQQPFPKSLANDFGTDVIYPLIKNQVITREDALRTYVAHIVLQIRNALKGMEENSQPKKMLVTGGGAFNDFLVKELQSSLESMNIEVVIPSERLVSYKEAMIMGLIGVLRWRQEYNVFSSVTGSARDSIGGALWTGAEA